MGSVYNFRKLYRTGPWNKNCTTFPIDKYWGMEEAYPITKPFVDHSKQLFTDAHRLRVKTVYHKLLRECRRTPLGGPLWAPNNYLWTYPEHAAKIRYKFEENRYITNPQRVAELIAKAEYYCYMREHAEPYLKNPHSPTGSAYGRNVVWAEHWLDPAACHPLPDKEWKFP